MNFKNKVLRLFGTRTYKFATSSRKLSLYLLVLYAKIYLFTYSQGDYLHLVYSHPASNISLFFPFKKVFRVAPLAQSHFATDHFYP